MKQYKVTDPEFMAFGRVITGYDLADMLTVMQRVPLPGGVDYVASVPELEALPAARELADGIYGQMPIQTGYCAGHNRKLNALEYHRDSEINVAVTDMVLLLGWLPDVQADYTLDTAAVKAFFVPAGTAVELYATTLHYAPCQVSEDGFCCIIVLPRGTNAELTEPPVIRCGEERLLAAVNKWLIGHEEGGLPAGSFIGLKGENLTV